MLNYQPVRDCDADRLREYYETCGYGLCEYSVGTKLMWQEHLNPTWAEGAGCLIVRCTLGGKVVYDYPVPGPEGDVAAALDMIVDECLEAGIQPVFSMVPREKLGEIVERYPYFQVSDPRNWRDYVYHSEDLREFKGRRYSGQRNHIKKFYAACPDAEFRKLTAEDLPLVEAFWKEYDCEFIKDTDKGAVKELCIAKKMLRKVGSPLFRCGGLMHEGRLVSLAMAEKCGETLIIHIEKALYSYVGVYPATVQAFARAYGDDVTWLNREDDAADRGLRTSKLQYGPAKLASKHQVRLQNELQVFLNEIPTLSTQRLTLTPLREEDIPAYNALVLDGGRNRWWGYDDVGGLGAPVEERSFFEVAQRDFANRLAVNFAVRLDGKLIGEAVLYRFDYRGGAELGCRIAADQAGHGYGTEAFAAVAEWAIFGLGVDHVVAKCFKENTASYKMLSSCMRPNGEDETYYYFEKRV